MILIITGKEKWRFSPVFLGSLGMRTTAETGLLRVTVAGNGIRNSGLHNHEKAVKKPLVYLLIFSKIRLGF